MITKQLLSEHNLDALLISSPSHITYFTKYSGFSIIEREAYLLITKNKQYLLTDGRYTNAVKDISGFTLIEISATNSLTDALMKLAKKHAIKKIGIEENNLTVLEYKKMKKCFTTLTSISLESFRIIKTDNEIKNIEKACTLGDETFQYILKKIKSGVSEKEIAFEIEFFIKKHGSDTSFTPIVAFGKNAAIPHHQTSNQKLITNNWVLLDFGAKVNNYCSDMTRTVFFGNPSDQQKHMYQIVLEAQQKAIDCCHPELVSGSLDSDLRQNDIMAKDIDKVARNYIISQGYPSIPHSLGHGIGLEVHESPSLSPNSKDIIKLGMVFSIEPGIYLPARHWLSPKATAGGPGIGGVRIEDLVVLEKSGPRLLTKSPRTLTQI